MKALILILALPALAAAQATGDALMDLNNRLNESIERSNRMIGQNHGRFSTYEDIAGNTIVRPNYWAGNSALVTPQGGVVVMDPRGNPIPAPAYPVYPISPYQVPSPLVVPPR